MSVAGWLGGVLTSLFWALSAICAQRAARAAGSLRANLLRLLIALALLAVLHAASAPGPLARTPAALLLCSGVVGFGIGDAALYLALARIGSRITVLITFCLSPLLAGLLEWAWLGQTLPGSQILAGLVILGGAALTIRPSSPVSERYGNVPFGFLMAVVAAAGQGGGAVLTRGANALLADSGDAIPALSQAFLRVAGGLAFALLILATLRTARKPPSVPPDAARFRHARWWILGTALSGPVIGVIFYQWALQHAPSGPVLAIVSLTPILVIPLAWWLERDRPTRWQVAGALVAILGLIAIPLIPAGAGNG